MPSERGDVGGVVSKGHVYRDVSVGSLESGGDPGRARAEGHCKVGGPSCRPEAQAPPRPGEAPTTRSGPQTADHVGRLQKSHISPPSNEPISLPIPIPSGPLARFPAVGGVSGTGIFSSLFRILFLKGSYLPWVGSRPPSWDTLTEGMEPPCW